MMGWMGFEIAILVVIVGIAILGFVIRAFIERDWPLLIRRRSQYLEGVPAFCMASFALAVI